MIAIGSKWRHAEGLEAEIEASGDDWVEPHGAGRWKLVDFEREWTQTFQPPPLPPEMQWDHAARDGTDGAHPAWWRGHHHGQHRAVHELLTYILDANDTYPPAEPPSAGPVADGKWHIWALIRKMREVEQENQQLKLDIKTMRKGSL